MRTLSPLRAHRSCAPRLAFILAGILGLTGMLRAQEFSADAAPSGPVLPREQAVHQALQNNPMLMTVRKQQGFAEAAIIIAKTYPYNPVFTGYVTGLGGPTSANILNRVYLEDYLVLEIELRGQGKIRRSGADATHNRIEAEIAQQEMAVSIAVIRAYNAVLYRRKKLELLDEGIKVNELQVEKLSLMKKETDLLLARSDLATARAQVGQARTTLAVARSELRRLLGTLDDKFDVAGDVDVPLPTIDPTTLTQLALSLRPDLRARRAAICEAQAALRLVEANRYGNPTVGPFFEYDPSSIFYIGGRLSMPVAILNTKKGEIHRAQTEVARVRSEVQQIEVQVSQDVAAALKRLADATKWATSYAVDVLPNLSTTKLTMEKMFANNDLGVSLPQYLTVQRSFLKATENFLDARYEVSQAECDLALAVAEPALALGGETRRARGGVPDK
jgi:outer membrane protein, heavy metal efflux system